MIVVTGAAGFIGSCLVNKLNHKGFRDIIVVDDFSRIEKHNNLKNKAYSQKLDRAVFFEWLKERHSQVSFIFHIGARTDTTEFNRDIFNRLNLNYSKHLWGICADNHIPLVYASSAATYGAGEHGYSDDHKFIGKFKPLNPYGDSKNDFDIWVLKQTATPPFWAGLKFFNVYGPNEYHKGRMASVIFHTYSQIKQTGAMNLFRSHKPDYKDGEQLRDFVYVKDVIAVCYNLMLHKGQSGIFNLGTGVARTFLDLARATFAAMDLPANIGFIDTPADIRDNYQYYTCAEMDKLRTAGYDKSFFTLEEGVTDYVVNYLMNGNYY